MDTRPQLLSSADRRAPRPGRRASAGLALLAALALVGGGCSAVVRADRSDARIYMEGEYIGTGMATTTNTGLPGTVVFTVEADGQRRENPVRREFRVGTFFVGMFTYMTGWLWCWQLPAEVSVLAPERRTASRWQRSPGAANPWRRAVLPPSATAPATVPTTSAEAPATVPTTSAEVPATAPATVPTTSAEAPATVPATVPTTSAEAPAGPPPAPPPPAAAPASTPWLRPN